MQTWHYMERYGARYPDNVARIDSVALTLDRVTAKWLVALHEDDAIRLYHFDAFMRTLRRQFEEPLADQ